jgi:integrase
MAEAVVLRPDGHSDFAALRTKRGAERATFVAFDLLNVEGEEFRQLPLEVRRAQLEALVEPNGAIIFSEAIESQLKANSIVNWFVALFKELGYEGCSSHSGRRSFITIAARNIHRSGCSLRDVQLLAGHRSIETAERYIDGDTCAQRRLVAYI